MSTLFSKLYFLGYSSNDSVLIFFAGHGTTYPSIKGDKGFLVPVNGTEEKMNTLISWDRLISDSELIKAKHIFFIMDACYSGLALLRGNPSKRFLKDMLRRQSRQILTAGKADQTVRDSGASTNHSIFTGYLLEALSGEAKTEKGIICASSVMNYVYQKVANDPKSNQTPGFGTVIGEGDFIFNYDEIFSIDSDLTKDNDILVDVDVEKVDEIEFENVRLINKIKNLLADSKNYIKITDIVNNELKIYSYKSSLYKNNYNVDKDEDFVKTIENYEEDIDNLLKIIVLLTYYGDNKYLKLIKKIFLKIKPKDESIHLLYYPMYLAYYVAIITGLESNNYDVLRTVLGLEINKTINVYYNEVKNLLIKTCSELTEISSVFSKAFPEKKYKYPLSEYVYKELQPIIDDFLYVGDEYPELFISTEILISFFYAAETYNEKRQYVWGPLGRYIYQLEDKDSKIEELPIYREIEKLGICTKISNKEDFISKYNEFLGKFYF